MNTIEGNERSKGLYVSQEGDSPKPQETSSKNSRIQSIYEEVLETRTEGNFTNSTKMKIQFASEELKNQKEVILAAVKPEKTLMNVQV